MTHNTYILWFVYFPNLVHQSGLCHRHVRMLDQRVCQLPLHPAFCLKAQEGLTCGVPWKKGTRYVVFGGAIGLAFYIISISIVDDLPSVIGSGGPHFSFWLDQGIQDTSSTGVSRPLPLHHPQYIYTYRILYISPWRIHGAAMVCHGSHPYTPVMLAYIIHIYIPAPWIHHGNMKKCLTSH